MESQESKQIKRITSAILYAMVNIMTSNTKFQYINDLFKCKKEDMSSYYADDLKDTKVYFLVEKIANFDFINKTDFFMKEFLLFIFNTIELSLIAYHIKNN